MLVYHLDDMKTVRYANEAGYEDVWSYRHCRGNYCHTFVRKVLEGDKMLNIDMSIVHDNDLAEEGLAVNISYALSNDPLACLTYDPNLPIHIFDLNRDARLELLLNNKLTNGCKLKFLGPDGRILGTSKKLWSPNWMRDAITKKLIKKKTLKCDWFCKYVVKGINFISILIGFIIRNRLLIVFKGKQI